MMICIYNTILTQGQTIAILRSGEMAQLHQAQEVAIPQVQDLATNLHQQHQPLILQSFI